MYRIVVSPPRTPERGTPGQSQKVADVEVCFDEPLSGLTLAGFTVWDNGEHGLRVSFPARRYVNATGQRRSFLLVRATDPNDRTTYDRLQQEILAAYEVFVANVAPVGAGAMS